MNLMQQIIKGSVSLALCIAMTAPYQSYAMQMNDPCFQMTCNPQESCTQGNYSGAGIAAILFGAAAGAGVGYAASHRNHRHSDRDCEKKSQPNKPCAKGCGCANDCLTFNINSDVTIDFNDPGGTYSATVQCYATTPNGCTVLGNHSSLTGTVGEEPITVSLLGVVETEACCGAYQIGILIEATVSNYQNIYIRNGDTYADILLASVTNCAGQTQYLLVQEDDFVVVPFGIDESNINTYTLASPTTLTGQVSIPYSYNPPSCGAPSCSSSSSSSCD